VAQPEWMIYGAYGDTGRLLAEEAVRRGHRPLLVGRSAQKLEPVAQRLGLPFKAVSLTDSAELARALSGMRLVLHAAGPFAVTSEPMVTACLAAAVSYLDVSGELSVFKATFARDEAAQRAGILLMPGAAFEIVPSDCLGMHVAQRVPGAVELEIAFSAPMIPSAGTAKSAFGVMMGGGFVRRNGELIASPLGALTRRVRFPSGDCTVASIPLADLVATYKATRIPNITGYIAVPDWFAREWKPGRTLGAAGMGLARDFFALGPIKSATSKAIDLLARMPAEATRLQNRSYLWARAADAAGHSAEAWLDTLEPYRYTERIAVRCVEGALGAPLQGALSPAMAFGADFGIDLEGTQRRE
jgi:short subunit dehydrogenase-like uncharacterized protein